ncbi:MAG: gliding motility-associated C-terminal domain-containing protein [Chitinophagaceae bacterium]|nr:MAG: gliding motility-associated C-terminal domain-containing protein [Chitinophagaceae bacterium]
MTRTLLLPFLLLCCSLAASAQKPPRRDASLPGRPDVAPWDARALDSLFVARDRNSGGTGIAARAARAGSGRAPYRAATWRRPGNGTQNGAPRNEPGARQQSTVCYTYSGRNFLEQDSLVLYSGDPTFTADGNVIVSGQANYYRSAPYQFSGFCMKTSPGGQVIWAKVLQDIANVPVVFINYFRSLELKNGDILLFGRTENRVTGNNDIIISRLTGGGNVLWTRTYESRFWQGYNGSGDYFLLRSLREDPLNGDIYFVGSHWGHSSAVTRMDALGTILWSNVYRVWNTDRAFGLVQNDSTLYLFRLELGSYNESYINITALRKSTGDTLFNKCYRQTGDLQAARLYGTFEMVRESNGHFLLSGPTTRYFEFPNHTGSIDLFHAGIIELDEQLNFVQAYGFRNRVESNGANTRISLAEDGNGLFTMFKFVTGYKGFGHISLFNNRRIYQQRKRVHVNEGIPYEPPSLPMPGGGFLNVKLMGDSTMTGLDRSHLDYYRIHSSDTASQCLGLADSSTSTWNFNFEPVVRLSDSVLRNVIRESTPRNISGTDFSAEPGPACTVVSHCDTLQLLPATTVICPGSDLQVTVRKNAGCGSAIHFDYDSSWMRAPQRLNDTTFSFSFNGPGSGYLRGSLAGCVLHLDSVLLSVLPAQTSLNLGPDTALCPGNSLVLDAGARFGAYTWQDGSSGSTFTVTAPGSYHLVAINSCGTVFRDTVAVAARPPVFIDLGSDRSKCNGDTVQLQAPPGFLSYSWSNNYQISSLSGPAVQVYPLVDTAYYIRAEKTPGCFAFDTVRIFVNRSPVIDLGADRSFCAGDSAVFNAGPGFHQYGWSSGASTAQVVARAPGLYSVTATTSQGCSSRDSVRVTAVHAAPDVHLSRESWLCAGGSRTLDAGPFAAYLWSTGASSRSISVATLGSYRVQVTDANGCTGSDSVAITRVVPAPRDFLPPDTAICTYGELTLAAPGPYSGYQWSTGAVTTSITTAQPGLYWLRVTDREGCAGTDSVRVASKECLSGLFVPDLFTPNNDGRNDRFRPLLFGQVGYYHFVVYNRWGQAVFTSTDRGSGWDGTFKGQKQDTNTYVWVCTYQVNGNAIRTEKGTVQLLR